jgi:hypothetical protein
MRDLSSKGFGDGTVPPVELLVSASDSFQLDSFFGLFKDVSSTDGGGL